MFNRFDRNIRFFGKKGQEIICKATVAIVGIGGLGTHIVQQLAHLGVGRFVLIDKDQMDDDTNLNRNVGSRHDDPVKFPIKVDIGERTIKQINPNAAVQKVRDSLISKEAFDAIKKADYVFGCVDREGVRFILNELCVAYGIPYIDLASDIIKGDPLIYGGRVCCAWDENSCLVCSGVLDMDDVQADLGGPAAKAQRDAIYGVDKRLLGEAGPSVISINGVVSSYAITEFMVGVTGIRKPITLATYRGQDGKITVSTDSTDGDCYYCNVIRGQKEKADVDRYIRNDVGKWL